MPFDLSMPHRHDHSPHPRLSDKTRKFYFVITQTLSKGVVNISSAISLS